MIMKKIILKIVYFLIIIIVIIVIILILSFALTTSRVYYIAVSCTKEESQNCNPGSLGVFLL